MLYKNLPENDLKPVMFVRCLLDYVAAFRFFFFFFFGHFSAVLKARREFQKLKIHFQSDRDENMRTTVLKCIPERSTLFLIWEYYMKGKKTYQYLKNNR